MADTKLTALSSLSAFTGDDLLYAVDDPAGTPASKKATAAVLRDFTNLTYSAYSTDGNLAAAVNTFYFADISGFSADRTLTLPGTAAVGDRVGLFLTVGDASFEFLITATSGDTLNGVAGGTEWSRVFIANECVVMRCVVANTTWVVEYDGRIPCTWLFTSAGIAFTANTQTFPDWTVSVDTGGLYTNAAKDYALIRRPGNYLATCNYQTSSSFTDGNVAFAIFTSDPNGTPTALATMRVQSGNSTDRLAPCITQVRNLAVDTTITGSFQQTLSTTSAGLTFSGSEIL